MNESPLRSTIPCYCKKLNGDLSVFEDKHKQKCSLLSGNTEGLSASTSGLGSLTSNLKSPEVSKTSMILGLSESFKIISHNCIHLIGNVLSIGSVSWVLLSVEEPLWDVVLNGSGKNIVDSVDLFLSDFSRSLVDINLSDLKCKEGKSSSDTSNLSKTEWSLLFTIDVCVLNSENMDELVWVLQYQ